VRAEFLIVVVLELFKKIPQNNESFHLTIFLMIL